MNITTAVNTRMYGQTLLQMAVYTVQPLISLCESDVPGAKFVHESICSHSVVELKRWLECRGLAVSGKKHYLVQS